jgi:hypothetical protein
VKNKIKIVGALVLAMGFSNNAIGNELLPCEELKTLSEMVMLSRQNDVDVVTVVDVMKNSTMTADWLKVSLVIVKGAYRVSILDADIDKKKAITSFSNMIYLECLTN